MADSMNRLRADLVDLAAQRAEIREADRTNLQAIRAAALRAMTAGLGPAQVAELCGINASTVKRWRSEARAAARQ
ncbi:helix-turn-helix domain-containing protein [Streptomyces mirabilis]|uniref:helix-turn-helix domain-containing protein n=1 Tax=Streptomyces mirabilis TaxID=68239 RepID=UPI0038014210